MPRYIDAEKLIRDLIDNRSFSPAIVKNAIENAPTCDVVEVVRCKDCEYCHISIDPKTKISVQVCGYVGYNPVQSSQVTDNDYCSHGERKE